MNPHLSVTPELCTLEDIPKVLALQARCYEERFIESGDAYATKINASPNTCWQYKVRGELVAYLFTLPCTLETLPLLDDTKPRAQQPATLFYVHDLAVDPQMKGRKIGSAMVNHALQYATEELGLSTAYLVAVQGSQNFWGSFGFTPVTNVDEVIASKLQSYGPGAVFMTRELRSKSSQEEGLVMPKLTL